MAGDLYEDYPHVVRCCKTACEFMGIDRIYRGIRNQEFLFFSESAIVLRACESTLEIEVMVGSEFASVVSAAIAPCSLTIPDPWGEFVVQTALLDPWGVLSVQSKCDILTGPWHLHPGP
jgi:hypothetical protein